MSTGRNTLIAFGVAAVLGGVYWGWVVKWKPAREKAKEDAKLLFKGLDAASTQEILLRKTGSADVLVRKVDGQWRLITPTAAPADAGVVGQLVSQLAAAKSNEVVDEKGEDLHEFGLDQPSGAVTFRPVSEGAKAMALFFGADSPAKDQAYAMIDGKPGVFTVNAGLKAASLKDFSELRDKAVWSFNASDVESVQSQIGGFTLSRDKDGRWQVDSGKRHEPGKGSEIDGWLGQLAQLKADSVPSETGKGPYGLSGGKQLSVTMKGGTRWILTRGGKVKPSGCYVQVAGQGPVFQLALGQTTVLEKSGTALMDLDAFQFRSWEVSKFEVQRAKGKLTAVKKNGVWAWEPAREQKAGEKEFDFNSFLAGLSGAQIIKRLDLKKDLPEKASATVTLYGDNGSTQETIKFGDRRESGMVAASAQKNQVAIVAVNLLDALPPDEASVAAPAAPGASTIPAAPKPAPGMAPQPAAAPAPRAGN
jgi:hypothetical protein